MQYLAVNFALQLFQISQCSSHLFTYKCTQILTLVFKSIMLLSYSVSDVTHKALKRLNRSEQEPDTVPVILCQCCFDIVWMLVEPNHLGLIEKLVNRQRERKKEETHACCLCSHFTFSSYLECTSCPLYTKNCCLSQT